jgi:homoserine dehydrogenase
MVAFEAAVAGGIPIIKALREGLTANRIEWLAGIINGTTNFILSEMRDKGLDFATVLKQAQELGYAEADPTFDIEGVDAAHKATIMSAIAFGIPVQFDKAHVEGISKLNAVTSSTPSSWATASSCWASPSAPRSTARKAWSCACTRPDPVQAPDRQCGRRDERRAGAGRRRRRHAVLRQGRRLGADRVGRDCRPGRHHLATADPEHRVPHLAFQPNAMTNIEILPMSEVTTSYYLRMNVSDQPGVLADLTRILADAGISIDAMLQKEPADGETRTDIIFLTHQTQEKNVTAAIAKMEGLSTVCGSVTKIRLENLS